MSASAVSSWCTSSITCCPLSICSHSSTTLRACRRRPLHCGYVPRAPTHWLVIPHIDTTSRLSQPQTLACGNCSPLVLAFRETLSIVNLNILLSRFISLAPLSPSFALPIVTITCPQRVFAISLSSSPSPVLGRSRHPSSWRCTDALMRLFYLEDWIWWRI